MDIGQGILVSNNHNAKTAGTSGLASNGLSVDVGSGDYVLGNDFGDPANPAKLLSIRQILMNGHLISLMDSTNLLGPQVSLQGNGVTVSDPSTGPSGQQVGIRTASISLLNSAGPAIIILNSATAANAFTLANNDNRNLEYIDNTLTSFIIPKTLTNTASLNFPNTAAQTSSDLTITVTGAALGDVVMLGVPNAAVNANSSYSAWVSVADTVTVRFNNYSAGAIDPAAGTFRVAVIKY